MGRSRPPPLAMKEWESELITAGHWHGPFGLRFCHTANYLKDTWVVTLKNAIKSSFKDVGKGWYEFSKLKKFLTQTKFIMEDTLRFLVEDSLQRLVAFVRIACSHVRLRPKLGCFVSAAVHVSRPVGLPVGLRASWSVIEVFIHACTVGLPLYTSPAHCGICVSGPNAETFSATKDGTRFQYSTSLDAIIPRFCAVYDNSLNKVSYTASTVLQSRIGLWDSTLGCPHAHCTQGCTLHAAQVSGIPVIEPSIMEELFWAIVPQLTAVHPLEEWVIKGKEELVARITSALVPVREYLAMYDT
eukprot:1137442-Pelagomonas_calceolata.AAC.1